MTRASASNTAEIKPETAAAAARLATTRTGADSATGGGKGASDAGSGKSKARPAGASVTGNDSTVTPEQLLKAYTEMLRARLVDEKAIVLYKQNKCHFQIGVAGHEAVQVAASHVFRPGRDWFYPYYRDMALCAGLGMTNNEFMLNAMNKQADPNSHGRQMPMHYGHKELRIVNQSSPTGTQFLQAVGMAVAVKSQKLEEVVYCSTGEGACAQGDFHEALNWASRDKLPLIMLVENNDYAISVHISEQLAGGSVAKLTAGYENLARYEIDGTDYAGSYQVIREAYARALRGEGPALIEAHVPRIQSHSISDNHLKYRSQKDIDQEKTRCPIAKLRKYLVSEKLFSEKELDELGQRLKREIDEAAEWAEKQPDPDPADALLNTVVDERPWEGIEERPATGEEVYLVDALNHALAEEMEANPKMYIFGQDVAHGKGGVFTVTTGLTARFGKDRVFNSQLAESSIAGVAIGMATMGLRPVPEIQFGDYVWTAMMQIRNELAMMNYRSGGEFTCPVVMRIPVGGYIHGGCYHSQSIEATFAHFPGLYVVLPSNATDAKGLLKAAIRGKDPVLFLEHKGLYRQVYAKGPEGDKDHLVPLGRAKVVRPGTDCTIVTWGAIVQKSLLAAKELEREGYDVEVIDLRTIVPLDMETVAASVKKTSRVLIAHEDVKFMGFGAEISAQLSENLFTYLDAPVKRVGMRSAAAVAHSGPIEEVVLPQTNDVLKAAKELLSF